MKNIRFLVVFIFLFGFFIIKPKAYQTPNDYDFKIKDIQTYSLRMDPNGGLGENSLIYKKFDGKLPVASLCRYSFDSTCYCPTTKNYADSAFDLSAYMNNKNTVTQNECGCSDGKYTKYFNQTTSASIIFQSDGYLAVLLDTGVDYSYPSKRISTDTLYKNLDLQSPTTEYTGPFRDYGWCPEYITLFTGMNEDDITAAFFGLYGFGIHQKAYSDDLVKNFDSVDDGTIYGGPRKFTNDVFKLKNSDKSAFTKEDKDYVDNLIYDLKQLDSENGDITFCDFSGANSNTYNNLVKILDYVGYLKQLRMANFKLHRSIDELLEANDYINEPVLKTQGEQTVQQNELLVESIAKYLAPGTKCYTSEYGSANTDKYEKLYDKAQQLIDSSNIDPGQNTIDTCEGLLGTPDDPKDVAYYLQTTLNFIKILGPVLIIALTILDYVKAIPSGDRDIINKTNKKTIIRTCAGIALFFAPILVKALFTLLGIYSDSDCNIG